MFTNCKNYIIFLFCGPASFSSYFFLSPFLGFLSSLIFALKASNHFSALSLSLPLLDVLPPSPMKCRPKHQGKPISIAVVSFSFSFLICDLMVDSAVVVWVMDLAVWIWPAWSSPLRVDRRGSSTKSSKWVSDRWVSLDGCFSFSVSNCWWWWGYGFVIWLWFWKVFFLFLVIGGEWWWDCGFVFVIWLWFWWLVVMVVGGDDSGSCCSCGGVDGWFYFFFVFDGGGRQRLAVGVGLQRKGETERKK